MQKLAPHVATLLPGAIFHGRYEIIRCMAAGGMGAIYEVIHRETRRRRALKTMLPELVSDPDLRARFQLEATITAEVDSEHIVEVFDAGVDEQTGMPFLAMELLKGEDLGALLARRKRLPPGEVVFLLHQASLALDQTHALGIVHRDLKPENLFLARREGGAQRLKVLDFGIAKIVQQSTRAKTTRSVGTPLYMAPEQARGDGALGPAVDLYALGHIAFTLLAGEAYWEASARRADSIYPLLFSMLQGSVETATARAATLGVTLPSGIDPWFAKATAVVPRERFETASELVEELARAVGVPLPRTSVPEVFEQSPPLELPSKREPYPSPAAAPTVLSELAGAAAPMPSAGAHSAAQASAERVGPPPHDTGAAVSSDRRPPPRRLFASIAFGAGALVVAAIVGFRWTSANGPDGPEPAAVSEPAPPVPARETTARPAGPAVEPHVLGTDASAGELDGGSGSIAPTGRTPSVQPVAAKTRAGASKRAPVAPAPTAVSSRRAVTSEPPKPAPTAKPRVDPSEFR